MLTTLSIRDVVLIEQLSLNCAAGLSVLTGETGAGKSILLDALGLALGYRGEARLVRNGKDKAAVTAEFDVDPRHPAFDILRAADIDAAPPLILRRVLDAGGKSRAFINDQPVSIGLLRQVGETLVEIHGQFETQGLLNARIHRDLLDSYGGLAPQKAKTEKAWRDWKAAEEALDALRAAMAQAQQEETFLRHAVEELDRLAPEEGEEARLMETRAMVMNREKLAGALNAAYHDLTGDGGAEERLGAAHKGIDRVAAQAGTKFSTLLETLNRMAADLKDAVTIIQSLSAGLEGDGQNSPDEIEERLFALKDLARKHRCAPDDLPALRDTLAEKLNRLDHQSEDLAALEEKSEKAGTDYRDAAQTLSAARKKTAQKLDKAVMKELPPLKLDKAAFVTELAALDESQWGPAGQDRVQFLVSTNPGTVPGPLHKIASGGELARFMLAIKVVLAATSDTATLIFDEVDSGIGGATADAVGERLARLSKGVQVLVVTHSPQVAARANQHWIVQKSGKDTAVTTTVVPLAANDDRAEEIARMLSGAAVTAEARAQARKLMEAANG